MSSPTGSQSPDPEISTPIQDESNDSHPQLQTETLEEEESQNQDSPQNQETPNQESQDQEIADQEGSKSHLEESPDEEFSGEVISLPPAIHVALPPMGGEMSDGPLASPTAKLHRRAAAKRKKGKFYTKKQQAIVDKKFSTLVGKLNPIPFRSSKILDFSKHEKLMKQLGLWEFVHIEFDQNVRAELIAQLVVSYDPKLRYGYVNGFRIPVNRADLGRALKLNVKKEKGGGANVPAVVDLDGELLSEESIAFIEDFVSNWVLLHEDTWIMPSEVVNWTKFIKDKHPEKVDWAGLFWFMVEKELMQGEQLEDCYYASHFQCLIKSQREEALFGDESDNVEVKEKEVTHEDPLSTEEPESVEVKEKEVGGDESDVKVGGVSEGQEEEEETLLKEANIELTLGQDVQKMEDVKDTEMVDFEEHVEEEEEDESEQTEEENEELEEEDEEQEEEDFSFMPNVDTLNDDGFAENLLQGMATHFMNSSGGPFFDHGCKRLIEHDPDIASNSQGGHKRMRVEEDPLDIGACVEGIRELMNKATEMYEAKDREAQECNMNNQVLLNEIGKRDNEIERLVKTKSEEVQKREVHIYRLERELFMMGNILEGYRKALKNTHKEFAEYRLSAQLPEEPIYNDAGPHNAEIEKLRYKQEEEYRSNCLVLEMKAKEAEEGYATEFEIHMNKVLALENKLTSLSNNLKEVKELYDKRKAPEVEGTDDTGNGC